MMITKVKLGYNVSEENKTEWENYKNRVRNLTKKNKIFLFETWDGKDYYDNEEILKYVGYNPTHRFYPTVDYKISSFYGFHNNISPEEISNIANLCITKRYINLVKNKLIEEEFRLKL